VDYNEISEKFLGKNVTQAAKDAALDIPIKKNEDEWSDEARKAAAEARKKGGSSGGREQVKELRSGLKSDDPIMGERANPRAWKEQEEKHGLRK
jgi:hypothetical protein